MIRARALGALSLVAALAVPSPAGAAKGVPLQPKTPQGVFGVSPSKRDLSGHPPVTLGRTLIFNSTTLPYDTTVLAAPITQRLDGTYSVVATPKGLAEARSVLQVSTPSFTLGPNSRRTVALRWKGLSASSVSAYIGLVITGTPRPVPGLPLRPRIQIVSLTFLQLPGFRAAGRITGLRASQGQKRTLLFYTKVHNTGKVHGIPKHTSLVIRNASGRIVVRTRWPGDTVLPGASREFPATVTKLLPKGRYTATSQMQLGTSPLSTRSLRFRLVGPNQLPTRVVEITAMTGNGHIDEPALIHVTVKNSGTAPSPEIVTTKLYRVLGGQLVQPPLAVGVKRKDGTKPGDVDGFDFSMSKLVKGAAYRGISTVSDGTREFNSYSVDFVPEKKRSFWDKFLGSALFWALLLLLALLALVLILVFGRRRRREEEEEQPWGYVAPEVRREPVAPPATGYAESSKPAPAPEPQAAEPAPPTVPPPAPDGEQPAEAVNINEAGVEDLMRLPGLGRRAAQRIVEHREQHGPFTAVEDLAAVEGFHSERVARLKPHIRL